MANSQAIEALSLLVGAGLGVVVDKVVGDGLKKLNVPNPQFSSIQVHDVALVAAELAGAYFARKHPMVRNGLLGMAGAVVTTDVYEVVAQSGPWPLKASYPANKATAALVADTRPIASGSENNSPYPTQTYVGNTYMI